MLLVRDRRGWVIKIYLADSGQQSCAYALKTFSAGVEQAMRDYGCREEAGFTHIFREWYEAADEPGLGPLERNIRCHYGNASVFVGNFRKLSLYNCVVPI